MGTIKLPGFSTQLTKYNHVWMNFFRLSHDRVTFDVDYDASTARLPVFIR